jgi:hypothetical protein
MAHSKLAPIAHRSRRELRDPEIRVMSSSSDALGVELDFLRSSGPKNGFSIMTD